jgi:hypothetical protein
MMAAKTVGRHKKGFKRPRKPPLKVLSDFGTPGNTPLAKVAGIDKRLASTKPKGGKEYYAAK